MNDITFCSGTDCPYKENCYRYLQGQDSQDTFSSWMEAPYVKETDTCTFFIED